VSERVGEQTTSTKERLKHDLMGVGAKSEGTLWGDLAFSQEEAEQSSEI
jgi:hypothetical protein